MRVLRLLSGILLVFAVITACQKPEPINIPGSDSGSSALKTMNDLQISDNFDWRTTRTLIVDVILPSTSKSLSIYSEDGNRLYFKGHSEDGSQIIKTRVTIPTYESTLLLKYGLEGTVYKVGITGNYLVFDFTKESKSTTDIGCDGDYDNDISTFDGFKFEFNGRTLNGDGTSTWSYTVTGVGASKDLSHWALALCEGHNLAAGYPNNGEIVVDPTLGIDGIKWDHEINKNGGVASFEFTLDAQYEIDLAEVGFKAGQGKYYCTINGPSCTLYGGGDDDDDDDDDGDDDDGDDDDDFGGNLSFEDLWPAKGDYDFNDLVVDYNFDITKNVHEEIEKIDATFIIRAFGASYQNGFGFTFPNVSPSQITNVSGMEVESGSIFNLAANGLEQGQSKATIIVLDNCYRIMPHPGTGIGVNTEQSAPYVAPVTISMEITFAPGEVTYSELDIGNFNPFIIVDQVRDVEVHLPDYEPTDLASGYFGTLDDASNPGSGIYYKTETNLPWAIHIPESFDYPIEKQDITGAHLKFAEWAESQGTMYPDWFQDKTGYRNSSLLY